MGTSLFDRYQAEQQKIPTFRDSLEAITGRPRSGYHELPRVLSKIPLAYGDGPASGMYVPKLDGVLLDQRNERGTLAHEMGHRLDFEGDGRAKAAWQKSRDVPGAPLASGYAATNSREHFAEAFQGAIALLGRLSNRAAESPLSHDDVWNEMYNGQRVPGTAELARHLLENEPIYKDHPARQFATVGVPDRRMSANGLAAWRDQQSRDIRQGQVGTSGSPRYLESSMQETQAQQKPKPKTLYEQYLLEQQHQQAPTYQQRLDEQQQKERERGRAQSETTAARARPAADPRSLPQRIEDFAEGAMLSGAHGATLGYSDELMARGTALAAGHPVKAYESMRQRIEQPRQDFAARHPVANFAAEGVGGVLAMTALGRALPAAGPLAPIAAMLNRAKPAASLVGRAGHGVATGAAIGGVAGSGSAEPGDRMAGAGRGAAAGAAIGALLPVAGAAGGMVLDATGARNTAPIRALARVTPIMDARGRARQMIVQAMERDKLTLPEAMARVNAGHPNTIMDLAGENTMGLGRGAASIPGNAKTEIPDMLHRRAAGASSRVKGELGEALGVSREDAGAKAAELVGRRSGNARPNYEEAYMGADVSDPAVLEALKIPAFARAHARGMRIAKLEGVDLPAITEPQSIRAIDYTKRGLDDMIDAGMRSGKMGRAEARALRQKLDEVLSSVDASNPEYAAARKQFADDSRMIEAHEAGTELHRTDPDEVARTMARSSPDAQQMYRSGAHDALVNKMEDVGIGRDVTPSIYGSETKQQRLSPIFKSPEAKARFDEAVAREQRMQRTNNFVRGGSNTANKLAEQTDMADNSIPALMSLARSPSEAMWAMAQRAAARGRGITEGTANELSPLLRAGGDPSGMTLEEMLRELLSFQGMQGRSAVRRAVFTRATGREAGDTAGENRP